jgi:hypothetical protein
MIARTKFPCVVGLVVIVLSGQSLPLPAGLTTHSVRHGICLALSESFGKAGPLVLY